MRRTGGITAFATVFTVVGALTFLYSLVSMVVPRLHVKTVLFFVLAGVNILLGIMWVVSGVGLFSLRRWARYLTFALAAATIVFKLLVTILAVVRESFYNRMIGVDFILRNSKLGVVFQSTWAGLLLIMCGLAIWYFSRRSVASLFSPAAMEEPADTSAAVQGIVIGPSVSSPGAYAPAPTVGEEEVLTARAWLVLKGPRGQVRHFPVKGDVVRIGRGARNDIDLEDTTVSEEHAKIYIEGGKYMLHDMGSLNGTRLNGHLILKHDLRDNDTIQVGNTTLVFKCA